MSSLLSAVDYSLADCAEQIVGKFYNILFNKTHELPVDQRGSPKVAKIFVFCLHSVLHSGQKDFVGKIGVLCIFFTQKMKKCKAIPVITMTSLYARVYSSN